MEAPKKEPVIIIDNSVDWTGAFKAIFFFAKYASKEYRFMFFLPAESKLITKVRDAGFEGEKLPFLELRKSVKSFVLYLPFLFWNAYNLKKVIQESQVKLVHVNDFYNLAGVCAKLLGADIALITHVRFLPDRFPKILVKFWINLNLLYSEKIVCVSNAVKSQLPPHPKICTIYDTLYEDEIKSIKPQTRHQDDGFIYLLYLANYIPGKGQNYALEAFYKAYHQDFRLRMKFVGGDMGLKKNQIFKKNLVEESKRLGICDVVEFSGSEEDVKSELEKADIVLNFSESESFSFVCLEALFWGKPLISSDCGGPAEIIDHGKTGLVVSNRNVEEMADAILLFSRNFEIRSRIAKNAFFCVRSKFSETKTYKNLKQLYSIVLNGKTKS